MKLSKEEQVIVDKIIKALKPLAVGDRILIIRAAYILLGLDVSLDPK